MKELTMYIPVSNRVDFANQEKDVLKFWEENNTFKKSQELRKDSEEFVFYDGPPFATGLPHYGHLLAGTIKDIVPRYQTMSGKYVERRFGWDCHGLPVEYEVEQALEISGKKQIEEMGVDVFNEHCRSIVLRYTKEWREVVTRMGRWVDFDNEYKTMDPEYMESIWWVFKSLWDKGLIYEGQKILPYCPRCSTPLSNFETNQGYQDVTDPAITVRFKVIGSDNTYVLAWTTTPWTLPSNMALAVGADITYVRVKDGDDIYILAKDRLPFYYKDESTYTIESELKGADLVGTKYEPLFDYFADKAEQGAFRICSADFVTTSDGAGIVHIAPGFGEDDAALGAKEGIPAVCPIDAECCFTSEVSDYVGRKVKGADKDITRWLKRENKLVHQGTIKHSYPHCWRCDEALIYRGISTWFVSVDKIKERLIDANGDIHWVPDHLKNGRFGKWLEGARDWAISRNRYWGAPLPIWRSDDGKEAVCIGSIEELEKLSGKRVEDLHKHFVDDIEIPSKTGNGTLKRIPEVLDCWFESGSMPYAQAHYPFENKEHFESHFPADFIAEGLDQTRGWFYTLMILSVALFDRPAFRNVIVNGLILASDGKKMSKRLKNYPDPATVIETYGADALRLYMLNSPVVRGEGLRFTEEGVKHSLRHLLIPLWNSYSFFVTYANIDGWTTEKMVGLAPSDNQLDRWIRSSMESLIAGVTEAMESYDLQRAVRPFVRFIEDLTNWYIRRSRRRFWKSQDDDDKNQAYQTLNYVLLQLSKIAAPCVPFISETIYQNLRTSDMPGSVHLCDFPIADSSNRDVALEEEMEAVMTIVSMGRLLRTEHKLKVRQPLAKLHVVCGKEEVLAKLSDYTEIMQEELNVKELSFGSNESELAILKAKANFRQLGPRFGQNMKLVAKAITSLDHDTLITLSGGTPVGIEINGESYELESSDVVIERIPREGLVVAAEGDLIVALETELSQELILEGLAREFVSRIQNMRKEAGLEVTQRIKIEYAGDDEIKQAVSSFNDYVKTEVLAVSCESIDDVQGGEELDLNGHICKVKIAV